MKLNEEEKELIDSLLNKEMIDLKMFIPYDKDFILFETKGFQEKLDKIKNIRDKIWED